MQRLCRDEGLRVRIQKRKRARVVASTLPDSYMTGGVQHFVPNDSVSKHQLLIYFQGLLNRSDITVTPKYEKNACDRTLITSDHPRNKEFWALVGFDYTPNIKEMVLTTMI